MCGASDEGAGSWDRVRRLELVRHLFGGQESDGIQECSTKLNENLN